MRACSRLRLQEVSKTLIVTMIASLATFTSLTPSSASVSQEFYDCHTGGAATGAISESYTVEVTVIGGVTAKVLKNGLACTGGVIVHPGITSIGDSAFLENAAITSVLIPNSVTRIGLRAFERDTNLTSVNIPNSVTVIDANAFILTAFTEITLPVSLREIGDSAFLNSSLRQIVIPDGVTFLAGNAFGFGYDLETVTIGSGITSIGSFAFGNAFKLTNLTLGSGLTSIGTAAFANAHSLKSVVIPNSVTSIGNFAFKDSESITTLTIGSNVTSIGIFAFYGLSSLVSLTIPNSLTNIGDAAFNSLNSLTSLTIGSGVSSIGEDTFFGASSLNAVRFLGAAPTTHSSAFSLISSGAKALVTPSNAASFTLTSGTWNGLIVELSAGDSPTAEQLLAIAKEAARVAAANREDQKQRARIKITRETLTPLTFELFSLAELDGVTKQNSTQVAADITALPTDRRGNIAETLAIARKFEVVGKVASGRGYSLAMLQEVALVRSDSKAKLSVIRLLKNHSGGEVDTYSEIIAVISDIERIAALRSAKLAALKSRYNH